MDLQEFNLDYLPIINLVISLTGVFSIIFLFIQYKKDNQWKKLQSPYNFIGIGEEFTLQERLYSVYKRLGIYSFPEVCNPLSREQVEQITSDMEATLITNMFLNHFQNLCTAYYFGLVDEKVFNEIHANRICWWQLILGPYIVQRRLDYNNPKIWQEFYELADKCSLENKIK